ncbi:uncharacterized protein TDEL_0C06280 [Torulaspora delbrueckii]|uniref:Uncharacterized protein n=1 Tax=Torulaspora delbrueckii TaxID=4950 RepID=G8ZQN0_TORDE|nr:hypothetical protein TDEL_0C06280 [Torulaspora delbrueckii]CCE91517.1 hypothetical protein TDEL_0C06280 [Torulaspora delbrueckii]
MIPPPIDAVLLHEHAYQDTGDLSYVLNLETFTDDGGYKPILKYGLGFFNYDLALTSEVYDRSWIEMFRFHLYENFAFYFLIFLALFLLWALVMVAQLNHAGQMVFGKNKKFEKEDDLEYHHIKV